MFQDLRYGLKILAKNPGFTVMAVLSLALGIGANSAIFTLLDAVLLKALPVKQPQQLVFIQNGEPGFKPSSNVSYSAFEQLRHQSETFSNLCFFSYSTRINASMRGSGEVLEGQIVSGSFFSTLGVDAAVGRTLTEADDRGDGNDAVVVISYRYWERQFALNPSVVGQQLVLNNVPFTIVGVTPEEFFGVIVGNSPDLFVPSVIGERILARRNSVRRGSLPFVLARLKAGVSPEQATPAVTLLLQQEALHDAGTDLTPEKKLAIQSRLASLLPADQGVNGLRQRFSKPLQLLMAAVGLVLLIACANVANLLLARAASRRREIALRIALGASRLRLIRQLLTEGLLLALIAGGFGLLLASWCSRFLLTVVSSGRNPLSAGATLSVNLPVDTRILIFTLVVSLCAAVLFGLVPAWQGTRLELTGALRSTRHAAGERRGGLGNMLVIVQLAMSLTLLAGAGLLVRSLAKLRNVDTGFKREKVLLFSVDPQLIRYDPQHIAALYQQMLTRIGVIPGVHSVSLARQGLLSGGGTQGSIRVPGLTRPTDENAFIKSSGDTEWNAPYFSQVGPNFFQTLGMTIIRGRDFGPQDNETGPKVAVVNEAFARYYFGNEDPVGRQFDRGPDDGGMTEIIGLVKDAKAENIREQTARTFYVPFLQDRSSWRETTFQVRTTGDPLNVVPSIRHELQNMDPNLAIFRVRTLEAQVDESLGQERLVTTLATFFGVLALVLASAGLYGVVSYSVNQRTQEIGIRMALGANRSTVLRMVLKQGMALTATGAALGLGGAYVLTKYLASLTTMLYGVKPGDPLTYSVTTALLMAIALLACFIPARRATKVDPLVALRDE